MQFTSALLVALSAAQVAWTAPAPDAAANAAANAAFELAVRDAAPLEKRQNVLAIVGENANFGGGLLFLTIGNACTDVPVDFNDKASSLTVAESTTCVFYADASCGGAARSFGANNPSFNSLDLSTIGFNDVISSYTCYTCSA